MLIQGDVSSNWLLPTFLSWNCPLSLHIGIFRSCPQGSLATMCACRHPHPTTGHWLRERRMQGPVSCATSSLPLTSRHHNSPWFLSLSYRPASAVSLPGVTFSGRQEAPESSHGFCLLDIFLKWRKKIFQLILNLFLCKVLENVLISFFYFQLSNFSSTTY